MNTPRRIDGVLDPNELTPVGNTLFFTAWAQANDDNKGPEVWKISGTTAIRVTGPASGPDRGGEGPFNLTAVGNNIFFGDYNFDSSGLDLWKTDGATTSRIAQLKRTVDYSYGYAPYLHHFIGIENTLFFVVDYGRSYSDNYMGFELWKSDGINTSRVADFKSIYDGRSQGVYFGDPNSFPAEVGNTLFFQAVGIGEGENGNTGVELWKTDGITTALVADIYPGKYLSSYPTFGAAVGNALYFVASDDTSGRELWKTDGATTTLVADIKTWGTAPVGSNPYGLTAVGNTLFFAADDGISGYELWKTDGTTTSLVANINPGEYLGSKPYGLTAVGDTLYFQANNGTSGIELWKTDGNTTSQVADINPGPLGSKPYGLTAVGNTLFFAADDGISGYELWKTDGTTTSRVADIFPGGYGSRPQYITAVGDTLYFKANDGTSYFLGSQEYSGLWGQLWALDISVPRNPSNPLDLKPGRTCSLPGLCDFDGILHGGTPEALNDSIAADYRFQGFFSLRRDGPQQAVFTNRSSGRWASAAVDPLTRQIDYADHGKGGITRVVGIYDDPLVKEGEQNTARPGFLLNGEKAPQRFGPFDSQRRFQNDLIIDNLSARLAGDFDGDGIQELYWKVNDGTAFLRSLLHDDGNIRYANYQSRDQMTAYLTGNGHADLIASVL